MVKIKQFSYGYQLNGVTKYSHGSTDIDIFTTGNFFKDEPNFLYIKNIFMKIQSIEVKEKDNNNNNINLEENPNYQKYQITNTKSGEKTYYWYNHTADWNSNYYIYYKYTNVSNGVIDKIIDSTLENQTENTEIKVEVTNHVYYSRNKNLANDVNHWTIVKNDDDTLQRYRRKPLDEALFSFIEPKYDFYFYFNGDKTRPLRAFFDGQDSFYFNIDQSNNQKVTLLQFNKDSLINNLSGQIINEEEKSKGRLILTITYETAD